MLTRVLSLLLAATGLVVARPVHAEPIYDCYEPVPGGWHVRLGDNPAAIRPAPYTRIGVISANDGYSGNGRLHRRPLYPPADRAMLFTPDELAKIERCAFRPLVLAYNEPRFLFDYHSAGGLLGHLYIGLTTPAGGKWFHQWKNLDVSYVDGRMIYAIDDPDYPGVVVRIEASAQAKSAGLILRVDVDGAPSDASLVWGYGGASAWFTNWAMNAKEFDFAPEQCAKDRVAWSGGAFTLTRGFDKSDVVMNEVFAVARRLPEWQARIQGGADTRGRCGFGDPAAFARGPADLVNSASWDTAAEQTGRVAVEAIALRRGTSQHYLVVGMGGQIGAAIAHPKAAWKAALARNAAIAGRVVVKTPDPYLNAAVPMMAFATEGTWGDLAVLHGGWSWRFAYLGWRSLYGMDCYGWTDRVRKTIQNHARLNRITSGPDEGALGSMLEYDPGVFYNMNEVFIDEVRQYFEYTNDVPLMREMLPVLKGIVAWENRRLRPTAEPLFENALNTWISDQHWYTRAHCTQASAYMLRANTVIADLARRLGEDPAPYTEEAARIREAMQRVLWMPLQGVFAEYKDTLGSQLLHPEPELPTIYHSAEFGAAEPFQIREMLCWAGMHLRSVPTPEEGHLYWSSNWAPQIARSYTHSTYELAYAENLNFALTNYLAGRADAAWAIGKACLAGIFNGPTPGGLACHAYVDGRQRANDEFSDASSMWGRTVVEGLFGIVPKLPDGIIELTPQFPSNWHEASIRTPLLSYEWGCDEEATQGRRKYDGSGDTSMWIDWRSPTKIALKVRQPLLASSVESVLVDGKPAAYRLEPGFGLTWVEISVPAARHGRIDIRYLARARGVEPSLVGCQSEPMRLKIDGAAGKQVLDLTRIMAEAGARRDRLEGAAANQADHVMLAVDSGTNAAPYLTFVCLGVTPYDPVPPTKIWELPERTGHDLARWTLVDLSNTYNASVTDAMKRVWDAVQPPPLPASSVNSAYYKDHLIEPFVSPKPSDAAWRAKIGQDGIGWTTDGIPFRSPKEGNNIGIVTRAGGFPIDLTFPVNAAGRTLYLMISGTTFAMQSHVPNLRLVLRYANGTVEQHELVNPTDIADCWNQYRYHDCMANGFENLGGRSGPAGSAEAGSLSKAIAVDTEAHLLAFDLVPGVALQEVRLEAVANDVIFGVMGASVLK